MILALLLGALAAATPRPTVSLRLWPCRGDCVLMAPAEIEARILVADPGRELRCPSLEIEWEKGGERSTQDELSPCDPFAHDDRTPTGYRTFPRRHTYRTGGERRVTVTVRGGDRLRAYRASRTVLVVGPSMENAR